MKYLLLFLMLPVLLAGSCTKNDGLTKETQAGTNTFSCKVNGKVFKPCKGELFSDDPLFGNVSISSGLAIARVYAQCTNGVPYRNIYIEIQNFQGAGEYLLSNSDNRCLYEERNPDRTFTSLLTGKGKVIITKDDRTNYILSGIFEFIAADENNPNAKVTVTDGRFDIKY